MAKGKKEIKLNFGDFSAGLNTTEAHSRIGDTQLFKSLDAMLTEQSTLKRPGVLGLIQTIPSYIRAIHSYLMIDGSEILLAVSSEKVYIINTSTGAQSEIYDTGGDGEAWFDTFKNKAWGCNGSDNFKVESDNTAYQIGITAPSGSTAVAASGGSLPDGLYKIFISYARMVGGDNVLYSTGQSVSDVTLGGGNNTIDFTVPNSADPQVGNKVVWMTDAAGAVYYFFHDTDDNTTISFSITVDRDPTAIIYSVHAQLNFVPPAFTYLLAFDNRIWGSDGVDLYYSLQSGTVYDLEKFNTQSTGRILTFPHLITGLFSIGANLYINTPAGIYVLPNGDPFAQPIFTEQRWNFEHFRTVASWAGGIIGLTNDGIRFFDGERFLQIDISRSVKKEIQKAVSYTGTNIKPCGAINRRNNRTEYHLCYRDGTVTGTNIANRRLVLNLDTLNLERGENFSAAWEMWRTGANYLAVTNGNVMYSAQSVLSESVIYKENA